MTFLNQNSVNCYNELNLFNLNLNKNFCLRQTVYRGKHWLIGRWILKETLSTRYMYFNQPHSREEGDVHFHHTFHFIIFFDLKREKRKWTSVKNTGDTFEASFSEHLILYGEDCKIRAL